MINRLIAYVPAHPFGVSQISEADFLDELIAPDSFVLDLALGVAVLARDIARLVADDADDDVDRRGDEIAESQPQPWCASEQPWRPGPADSVDAADDGVIVDASEALRILGPSPRERRAERPAERPAEPRPPLRTPDDVRDKPSPPGHSSDKHWYKQWLANLHRVAARRVVNGRTFAVVCSFCRREHRHPIADGLGARLARCRRGWYLLTDGGWVTPEQLRREDRSRNRYSSRRRGPRNQRPDSR